MIKRFLSQRIYIWLMITLLTMLGVLVAMKGTNAQSSVISEQSAVERALAYAQEDGRVGGATAKPAEIRGQVMTYDQAVQRVFGRPIGPNDAIANAREYPVWLVILRGKFMEHVPSSPDGSIPAQEILHTQMAIILDGNTGEIIERVMISPHKPLPVSGLPVLVESSGPIPALPTKGPISTEIPEPTLSPE